MNKPHGGTMEQPVALDGAIQLMAMGMNETLDSQALRNSTVSAENHPATGTDGSAEPKRKKSPKNRPICLICNKSFHTNYKLNEHHAIVHLDKRLFSCNVCQKKFGRPDHLIRHVKHRVCIQRQNPQLPDASGNGSNFALF